MKGGRLRNLVEIWKYEEIQDEFGQPKPQWLFVTKAWAEIRPLLGREGYHEKMEVSDHTHKILMRYIHLPLDATMQIRYNGRTFELMGPPSDWMERNIQLQFNVKEVFDHDEIHPIP